MATTSLDPEEALELLGADEPEPAKEPSEEVQNLDLPPLAPVKPGFTPSAAATAIAGVTSETDAKARLMAAQKAKEKAEADKERLEKQLKTTQESERKSADKLRKLEDEIISLKKDLGSAKQGGDGGGKAESLKSELDDAKAQIQQLQMQLAAASRAGSLPVGDDSGAMPKEGSLDQIPYARILVRLLKEKFTGRLSLRTGSAKREVYFDGGAPVAYSSSEPGERLGRVLVTRNCITEAQYLAAAQAMVERGAKLTEALLEMGAIDSARLQQEQRTLTRDQIINGFSLTQGTFATEAGKAPPDESPKFEFKTGEIYVQGYRKYAPESEIKELYAALKETYYCPKPELSAFRAELALEPDDERVLKVMSEAYTVEEAVERSALTLDRVARLLGALKLLGLVGPWKPGVSEFEARLRAEKLRQAEEVLALKQKIREREEQLMADFQGSLKRLESLMQAAKDGAGGGGGSSSTFSSPNPTPARKPPAAKPSPPTSAASAPPPPAPPAAEEKPVVEEKAAPPPSSPAADFSSTPPIPASPSPSASVVTTPPAPTAAAEPDAGGKEDGPGHDRYREGMRHAAAGRLDEAEGSLREAVRMDATKPSYLTALARVLLANPRYERAGTLPVVRSLLDRAQALAPGDAEVSALLQRIQQELS